MSQDPQSINAIAEEFKKTGWLFAVLGGLGMLARLILTDEKYHTTRWIRMVIAGAIVGVICYFSLYNADIDPFYKSVLCSISGSLAPEMFNWVRNKFIQKTNG
jgi:hypothetical protein